MIMCFLANAKSFLEVHHHAHHEKGLIQIIGIGGEVTPSSIFETCSLLHDPLVDADLDASAHTHMPPTHITHMCYIYIYISIHQQKATIANHRFTISANHIFTIN